MNNCSFYIILESIKKNKNKVKMKQIIGFMLCAFFAIGIEINLSGQCEQLIWSDEFNGDSLNTSFWNYEVGGNNPNSELEFYTSRPTNIKVDTGNLIITANKETYSSGGVTENYTSGRINTSHKFNFKYGKIEARMKLPYGQGIWPAFWMLGQNIDQVSWPNCGEMDIMEMVGGAGDNTVHTTLHWGPVDASGNHPSYGLAYALSSGKFADAYHIFTLEWTPQTVTSYVDGNKYYTISISPAGLAAFQNNFFIIFNLAVGGSWPGNPDATTVFPQHLFVDYVRVYADPADLHITGDTSVVTGQENISYQMLNISGAKYHWILPQGASINSTADSSSVNINWGCKSDTIKCEMVTSCDSVVIKLPVKVTNPVINSTTYFIPASGNALFTSTPVHGGIYNWTVPVGDSIISGQGSDSLTVKWSGTTGYIKLNLISACDTLNLKRPVLAAGEYPYPDPTMPHEIPGTIDATQYDFGGEGVAYHDDDVANQGQAKTNGRG